MENDYQSPAMMALIASLMAKAAETKEGLEAMAAAVARTVETEIRRKEISSLLLTRHNLPKGERALFQKRKEVKAYWISKHGDAVVVEVGDEEIEIPIHRIHSAPSVDVSVLKHGNIGSLQDIQQSAADEIRTEMDRRTLQVISHAVPDRNVVEVTGGKLTEDAFNEAVSILEDKELTVKYITMRGRRFNDLRSWNLDQNTRLELRQKGVVKNYGTGSILLSASAEQNEVLITPDREIGKLSVRENLRVQSIDEPKRFRTGWLLWSEVGPWHPEPGLDQQNSYFGLREGSNLFIKNQRPNILILPGAGLQLQAGQIAEVQQTPEIDRAVRRGHLQIIKDDQTPGIQPHSATIDLSSMGWSEATDAVQSINNLAELDRLLNIETRRTVQDAINKRKKEISNANR